MYLRIESAPAGLHPVQLGPVIGDVCPLGWRSVFQWLIPRWLMHWVTVGCGWMACVLCSVFNLVNGLLARCCSHCFLIVLLARRVVCCPLIVSK
jgi:hypothetical protein